MEKKKVQIAIDGPVAAGCTTVARKLAEALGVEHIDTGAMYRVATLLAMRKGIGFDDEDRIVSLVRNAKIDLSWDAERGSNLVVVDGEDVSDKVYTKEVDANVGKVAALPGVRRELVVKQQEMAKGKEVVMVGRDIAVRVLPQADLKIYLDAREEVRVERRVRELRTQGLDASREGVARRLRERDEIDKNRKADPLKVAEGAWYLDSSDLTIDEVMSLIKKRVQEIRDGEKE